MSGRANAALHLVEEPARTDAEAMLAMIVPPLLEIEAMVVRIRALMAEAGRDLAKERGVTFIREEQIRREFGGGERD